MSSVCCCRGRPSRGPDLDRRSQRSAGRRGARTGDGTLSGRMAEAAARGRAGGVASGSTRPVAACRASTTSSTSRAPPGVGFRRGPRRVELDGLGEVSDHLPVFATFRDTVVRNTAKRSQSTHSSARPCREVIVADDDRERPASTCASRRARQRAMRGRAPAPSPSQLAPSPRSAVAARRLPWARAPSHSAHDGRGTPPAKALFRARCRAGPAAGPPNPLSLFWCRFISSRTMSSSSSAGVHATGRCR